MPQHTPSQHPVMQRVGQAVMLHRAGDREEARNRLAALWADPGPGAGPLQRCTIAHYLAAAQDDPRTALHWDLVALAEADAAAGGDEAPPGATRAAGAPEARGTAEDAEPAGPAPRSATADARGLYPLLYLRLAGDHVALDCVTAARHELGRARRAAARLRDDDHGRRTRAAVESLAARLAAGSGRRGGGGDPPPHRTADGPDLA
ncbi:hypothetical protein [Streptomyces lonarensis]|uniref:hypothetical protein n=1 Tax=Streptomyces lonarensis TaxID=700599 RepID=UPI001ADD6C97|nr:hypothetical protein [Streptomyces lonarensis]